MATTAKATENSKLSHKCGEGFLHRLIRQSHARYLRQLGHDVETSKVGIGFILKNGIKVYPDIIDFTTKTIYEVQNCGERKDSVFENLRDGWGGGHIFISNVNCTEDYIYKPNGDMDKIDWKT